MNLSSLLRPLYPSRAHCLATALSVGSFVLAQSTLARAQTGVTEETAETFPEQSNQQTTEKPVGASQPTATTLPASPPVGNTNTTMTEASTANIAAPPSLLARQENPAAPPACVSPGPAHSGFYFRIGSGPTILSLRGNGPNGRARATGFGSAMNIAVGGSLTRGLVLAGTVHGAQTTAKFRGGPFESATISSGDTSVEASDQATIALSTIGLLLDFYPSANSGWHAGLSVGLGMNSLTNHADNSSYNSTGVGGMLLGGYDWHVIRDWSIGLNLVASATSKAAFKERENQHSTEYKMGGFSIGVQSSLLYF